jgi:hypothetical protein
VQIPSVVVVLVTLVASATLGGACSTSQVIERPHSLQFFADTVRIEGVDSVVVGRPAVAPIAGGGAPGSSRPSGTFPLRSIDRTGVTISWGGVAYRSGVAGAQPNHTEVVPFDDVRGYAVTKHGLGAGEGFGLGLLGGAALGVLAGATAGSSGCGPSVCVQGGAGLAEALGIGLGLTGAILGALVGVIVGHTDHYTFGPPDEK